eukprot:5432533-Amphidinium_carterae.1
MMRLPGFHSKSWEAPNDMQLMVLPPCKKSGTFARTWRSTCRWLTRALLVIHGDPPTPLGQKAWEQASTPCWFESDSVQLAHCSGGGNRSCLPHPKLNLKCMLTTEGLRARRSASARARTLFCPRESNDF